jgi:hypothetical protein
MQTATCIISVNNMSEVKLPRWIRILFAIFKNWKETLGSAAILFTLYLWYFDKITQEKAIFGIILLVAGGFVTNAIDIIDLFKYIGNYKKKGDSNGA